MNMGEKKKHFLHELLNEDQEPFLLNTYISEKQNQINKKKPKKTNTHNSQLNNTTLQLKKQKPAIIQNPNKTSNFLPINLCFNTNTKNQDITKSPLFKIPQKHINNSNCKSPCSSSSPNTIFLHVPARTASILLEAALRIQKHSKTKPHYNKSSTFGLLGSLFKRLTQRKNKKTKRQQIEGQKGNFNHNFSNNNVKKVKDILRFGFDSCSVIRERKTEETEDNAQHYCDACFEEGDNNGFFCESPFRFVLQRNPSTYSSARSTPEFSSPAVSPTRRKTEDKKSSNNEGKDNIKKFQSRKDEDEEEKEQCSPVSVLDPPFEDDDDVHENDYEEDGFDLECSYANVQRTKQQLLYRLCRFEKLAELDPLELEKRMLEQDDNECETSIEDDDNNSETSYEENNELKELVYEILFHSSIHSRGQVSEDLKKLVSDLIIEEEFREVNSLEDREMVIKRVCERLELWKEVDSNTIDMMVDEDFSREEKSGWIKKNSQEVKNLAGELEFAIFTFLVDEFSEELIC